MKLISGKSNVFEADRYGGRARVVLGDDEGDRFIPRIDARRFASPIGRATEQRFAIWHPDAMTVTNRAPVFSNGILEWAATPTGYRRHRFFEVGDDSIEYEIDFSGPDDVPEVVEFAAEFPLGCSAILQPALTQEDIDNGAFQPTEMLGGYVFFVPQHGRWLDSSFNEIVNYETGRWGHLLRPWARDSTGSRTWCDWEAVDVAAGVLALRIPRAWLDRARGVVTVGPTFGLSSVGAFDHSGFGGDGLCWFFGPGTPATAGDCTSISFYKASTADPNGTFGLYDNSSSAPNNRLQDTGGGLCNVDNGINTQSLDSSQAVSTVDYWFALAWGGSGITLRWDTAAATYKLGYKVWTYSSGGPLPNPAAWTQFGTSKRYTIYGTYTEAAAGNRRRRFLTSLRA